MTDKSVVVIIPAYDPPDILDSYVRSLNDSADCRMIVIDDGSHMEHAGLFRKLEEYSNCTVLHHESNKGKGAALKTAFQYVLNKMPECETVVTADSDGQHLLQDIKHMAEEAKKHPDSLILGERNFSQPGVPHRSAFGNRCSSILLAILYGKWIPDTQTGLRGFNRNLIQHFLQIDGYRFEYETAVLIACIRENIPIRMISINTVYSLDDHKSHFNTFSDGIKVVKVLFAEFFKYTISSILCAILDLGLAWLILYLLRGMAAHEELLRIFIATCGARAVSTTMNFLLNRNLVFHGKGYKCLARYLILCVCIMCLSSLGVYFLRVVFNIDEISGKLLCDTFLFLISYYSQEHWVFSDRKASI